MREPPPGVSDQHVLDVVRREWRDIDTIEHLPVGFGAHHWKACRAGEPVLFVTYDRLLPRRSLAELEAAYAGAAVLAETLQFVLASLPSASGRFAVALGAGAASVTPWTAGRTGDGEFSSADEAAACAGMLQQLHATPAPAILPRWRPLVAPDFADSLSTRLHSAWHTGPHGETARTGIASRLPDIRRWTTRYHELARVACGRRDSWLATHGEPDTGNQIVTGHGRLLVDWESAKLAAPERDFRALVDAGFAGLLGDVDDSMLEMFDLEWRLDEISQYADWFEQPHTGSASDAVALQGLLGELERDDWRAPRDQRHSIGGGGSGLA